MKPILTIATVGLLCIACFGETPSVEERTAVIQAAVRYRNFGSTNQLQVVEAFYKKYPDTDCHAIGFIKADKNSIPMLIRLLKETPESSVFREAIITTLRFAPETDEMLKLFIETALNRRESEEARLAAIYGLMESKWTNRQPTLVEIYLKLEEEKYHERMLEVCIYHKRAELAEVFLGYYRHFHPERDGTYARHYEGFQKMKAKLAEDAKNPRPDPVALIQAQREWWNNFFKKERNISLAQAKAGLVDFSNAPVLDRLELVYAIQQSGAVDAEVLQRMEHLVPGEPSGFVKMSMITTIASSKPTTQAMLQYYRHVAKTEKDAEVVASVQTRIKLIEEGKLKR